MATFDLVFEGGGVKGAAFVGALQVLKEAKHDTRRLIGTSAGAITVTCIAAGYTPDEMLKVVKEQRDGKPCFCAFLEPPVADDFPPEVRENSQARKLLKSVLETAIDSEEINRPTKAGLIGLRAILNNDKQARRLIDRLMKNRYFVHGFSLLEDVALFSDRQFIEWMEERLMEKGFEPGISLREFYKTTNRRHLTVVAADTWNKEMLILNHHTAPDCPVVQAVRMSMGIPFVWKEKVWDNEKWGLYRGRMIAQSSIVDGGVLSNFPLRLLIDKKYEAVMDAGGDAKIRNLGLLIDESALIPGAREAPRKKPSHAWQELRISQSLTRLVETVLGAWDRDIIEENRDDVCFIAGKGIDALEFDLTEERMDLLINSGRCAMTQYLNRFK